MFNAFQRVSSIAFGLLPAIALITITPSVARAQNPTANPGQLLISEFRLRGPGGAGDEFIEIYGTANNVVGPHIVTATSGTGYGIAASDGVTRCTIPNGTRISRGQTFLCVNSTAYSLAAHPGRETTTATGDATYTTDIPDNAGLAIFNNNTGGANYSLANRLDAVGSTAETNTLYKEGTGYPALTPFSVEYSFVRDFCGKQGAITTFGPCPSGGFPVDTNNNATDFFYVATNLMSTGAGQRLGAPGPQNLSAPLSFPGGTDRLLDSNKSATGPPNRVRDLTSNPANNSTFGTIEFRRRLVSNSGLPVLEVRLRIIDLTTSAAPPGIADLRALSSGTIVVDGITEFCEFPSEPSGPCSVTVRGLSLEQPPAQPNGGGFNSSLRVIGGPTGLNFINVRFLFGVQQPGSFKFYIKMEVINQFIPP
jgi:hypothetical protein